MELELRLGIIMRKTENSSFKGKEVKPITLQSELQQERQTLA